MSLNYYLNHPEIHPNIAPDGCGFIDGNEVLCRNNTVFIDYLFGSLLFIECSDNIYTLDAYFLRKSGAKPYIKQGINYMFEQRQAKAIIAEAPDFNLPSRYIIRSLGFELKERRKAVWKRNGQLHDVLVYQLEKHDFYRQRNNRKRIKECS